MSTTEAENKEIVRRISGEAFGEGDLDLVDEYFADDFIRHSAAAPEDIHGLEDYKQFLGRTHVRQE